ncbi:aminoglycoside 3'-phosphotransferase [Rhizobium sp. VS19-DR104.2]|uniref:APH(3') family aminoglycoside O-phosphotransferase n=1 Tax=unclassified Rhizobium TaxID=2613769 RepID=UPI001CC66FBE|nr:MULTISPECIES: APH(3') family aminoglycoside O-phosphotransferase [unclassified Rhizobium]MBZ5763749.1 aminoglycoside 3'-phosphotransferase [Rhizobium sp. VS19-DR96]MBZ5769609.1 aminoglycoside 3'-phosphotransferase [Rhizobium sp. VS19-DR129.2]MBZ5776367.1 aminoglycoside 3'-phosphotransferase [Rhizobium sp. VS19-DRK62.2]MBZ5787574.1 aminoglycoside 3'-phosphotransferase [Rhizobium sp. VS19-DR121]MBZ5804929.1 aminoglycoside 3'-phosphotransferase [Rhizobium sp. VS19-DR181]
MAQLALPPMPKQIQLHLSSATLYELPSRNFATRNFVAKSGGTPISFLKFEEPHGLGDLGREFERTKWLGSTGFPSAKVIAFKREKRGSWLLTQAVEGSVLSSMKSNPSLSAKLIGGALKQLHSIPAKTCPFIETWENKIFAARERLLSGLVDESDFDEANKKTGAFSLLNELSQANVNEELVVTHGDSTLANFIFRGKGCPAAIDCGRLGISDIHCDLALAIRSIRKLFGNEHIPVFINSYGNVNIDCDKLRLYTLLDEFF